MLYYHAPYQPGGNRVRKLNLVSSRVRAPICPMHTAACQTNVEAANAQPVAIRMWLVAQGADANVTTLLKMLAFGECWRLTYLPNE